MTRGRPFLADGESFFDRAQRQPSTSPGLPLLLSRGAFMIAPEGPIRLARPPPDARLILAGLLARQDVVPAVTVFRGDRRVRGRWRGHADDVLRFDVDLPVVIKVFDEPPAAEASIHVLEAMVAQGHILDWPVKRHGAAVPPSPQR
ncbi:MAG: DUF190 domain-containing protein [Roseiarcus sp.]